MFRKLILTAVLTAAALTASSAARAQDDQQWKLGVVISNLGGGDRGVVVNQVFDNSPAKDIGLEAGDVLLTVNGDLASDPLAVRDTIFACDQVALVIKRGNGYFRKDVTFSPANSNDQANAGGGGTVVTTAACKVVTSVKTRAVQAPSLPPAKPTVVPGGSKPQGKPTPVKPTPTPIKPNQPVRR